MKKLRTRTLYLLLTLSIFIGGCATNSTYDEMAPIIIEDEDPKKKKSKDNDDMERLD